MKVRVAALFLVACVCAVLAITASAHGATGPDNANMDPGSGGNYWQAASPVVYCDPYGRKVFFLINPFGQIIWIRCAYPWEL